MELFSLGQPFDGEDLLVVGLDGQTGTGVNGFAVHETVQAPQLPRSQNFFVPVRPISFLSTSRSVQCDLTFRR